MLMLLRITVFFGRLREQAQLSDSHNLDLTFSVLFNLATQYDNNEMYTEALNTYSVSIRCNVQGVKIKLTLIYKKNIYIITYFYHNRIYWSLLEGYYQE